jgi:hypothetical protein
LALTAQVFRNANATLDSNGQLQFDIGLPWFRSLPMSAILRLEARVDEAEEALPLELLVDGHWVAVDELASFAEVEWFVQDLQTVRVKLPAELVEANSTTVELKFGMMMPSMFMKPGDPIVINNAATATLRWNQ